MNILLPRQNDITSVFSPSFANILESYVESITHVKVMQLVGLNDLNGREKSISSALYIQSIQIKKQNDVIPTALSKKLHSSEFDFTVYIFPLINTLFLSSKLRLRWYTTSDIYMDCPYASIEHCSHTMVTSTAEGIEIGTGEIFLSGYATIDDRSRIVESLKKQLHRRLCSARNAKELQTFSIIIPGNIIKLTTLSLSQKLVNTIICGNLSLTLQDQRKTTPLKKKLQK